MNHFDVERSLRSMVILIDTREQDTMRARKRWKDLNCPYERSKLDFGDYSVKCDVLDMSKKVVIERKMDFTEMCGCFCQQRLRFVREFERAKESGAKTYLLIENASFEKAYEGDYRSKMLPQSLIASLLAWIARYNCQLIFCEAKTTGKLIHDILYRELKEALENLPDEPDS